MKSDIEKYNWKAVHSNKTVYKPNYADIDRTTLESFTLFDEEGTTVFNLTLGDSKKLFVRLSSEIATTPTGHTVRSRFWKIGVTNPLKFHVIKDDGTVTEHNSFTPMTETVFRTDEL